MDYTIVVADQEYILRFEVGMNKLQFMQD